MTNLRSAISASSSLWVTMTMVCSPVETLPGLGQPPSPDCSTLEQTPPQQLFSEMLLDTHCEVIKSTCVHIVWIISTHQIQVPIQIEVPGCQATLITVIPTIISTHTNISITNLNIINSYHTLQCGIPCMFYYTRGGEYFVRPQAEGKIPSEGGIP